MIAKMDDLLMSSVFCLNPPGDTPTRKGLFDSMLAGCIPVIFDEASLSTYRWYIKDVHEVSVFIPPLETMPPDFNVVDYLTRLRPDEIRSKQDALRQIAFSLQYSEGPTSKNESRLDAFDVAMVGLGV